jgi:subtilase family serine protease
VQVYNDGPAKSAPTQLKLFYSKNGTVTTAQAPIPAIASKGSVWVVVGAGLPLNAADSVTVRADDPNVVNEKDELNNGFKYK